MNNDHAHSQDNHAVLASAAVMLVFGMSPEQENGGRREDWSCAPSAAQRGGSVPAREQCQRTRACSGELGVECGAPRSGGEPGAAQGQ